jgi:hypothetical protein
LQFNAIDVKVFYLITKHFYMWSIENSDKVALIQSPRAQGREPKTIKLEEVAGEKAIERDRYWTSYYKSQGYKITNRDYRSLSRVDAE